MHISQSKEACMAEAQSIDKIETNTKDEQDFDNMFEEDETVSSDSNSQENSFELLTHDKIKANLCGSIITLEKGYAKTTLQTTTDMALDDIGLIHSGFVIAAADYAAAVSVNEANLVMIDSRSKLLAPARLHDLIIFEAKAKFEESKKREIKVIGKINDIKVYEGIFHAVVLEKHILKNDIKHMKRQK